MTETDAIQGAERAIREALNQEREPVSARRLGELLEGSPSKSLLRVAVQRMIGKGEVNYDAERRYALKSHLQA
jgi:hypothetical protein